MPVAPRTRRTAVVSPVSRIIGSQDTFAELRLARRVAALVAPELSRARVGVDFSNPANVRVSDGAVTLLVRTGLQKRKIEQLLPRMTRILREHSIERKLEIRVSPRTDAGPAAPAVRAPAGLPRELSGKSAELMRAKARELSSPELREMLERLAASGRGK